MLFHMDTRKNFLSQKVFESEDLVFQKSAQTQTLAETVVIFWLSIFYYLVSTESQVESDFQIGDLPS